MVERSKIVKIKCGHILLMSDDNFSLICGFCERDFYTLVDLRDHLKAHLSESQTNPKTGDSINCSDSEKFDVVKEEFIDYQDDTGSLSIAALTASPESVDLYETKSQQNEEELKRNRDLQLHSGNENGKSESVSVPINFNEVNQDGANVMNSIESNTHSIPERTDSHSTIPMSSKVFFECSFCGKLSNSKIAPDDLDENISTRKSPYPFECHICFKSYAVCSNLSIHLWNVHKLRTFDSS